MYPSCCFTPFLNRFLSCRIPTLRIRSLDSRARSWMFFMAFFRVLVTKLLLKFGHFCQFLIIGFQKENRSDYKKPLIFSVRFNKPEYSKFSLILTRLHSFAGMMCRCGDGPSLTGDHAFFFCVVIITWFIALMNRSGRRGSNFGYFPFVVLII